MKEANPFYFWDGQLGKQDRAVSVVLAVMPFTQVPPNTNGIPKDDTGDESEMPRKHSTSRKRYHENRNALRIRTML